ncbi:uncharacterized protein C8orf48 isoform X2 [Xenopus laevis]|uniref:Uncharacterized protein C8orf48 isoform X2 n=1 Tax=Xenopus laevis TaxID=8355 RepID=A0A8J0TID4_XENLA|nr:uncharacterized protein C8orf48 isoform X2 [Xenopus laevis]
METEAFRRRSLMDGLSEDGESIDYEEHIVQNTSCSRGSGCDYSSESFESLTDSFSDKDESEPFKPCSSEQESNSTTASSENGFGDISVCSEHGSDNVSGSEPSEVDYTANVHCQDLIKKWIENLQFKHACTSAARTNVESRNAFIEECRAGQETAETKKSAGKKTTEKETETLHTYCLTKIKHITHPLSIHKKQDQHTKNDSKSLMTDELKAVVPQQLLNRLRLENMKETLRQVTETGMHQPSTCPHCTSKRAELAKCEFLRLRRTKLEASLLQSKMEEHMYTKDLLTCIGEIHQSLPRLSDGSSNIWKTLYASSKKT